MDILAESFVSGWPQKLVLPTGSISQISYYTPCVSSSPFPSILPSLPFLHSGVGEKKEKVVAIYLW